MTIPAKFMRQASLRPNRPAYATRHADGWHRVTWGEYVLQTRQAGRALIALGQEPGDTACIIGFNRPEWTIFNMAAMSCGGVPAGIYTTNSAAEVAHIIRHCRAKFLLIEDLSQWAKIKDRLDDELAHVEHIITMRDCPAIEHPKVLSWADFLSHAWGAEDERLEARIAGLSPAADAALIYTSGTTGPAKGVRLTHRNLYWTAETTVEVLGGRETDEMLSFLPLSHVAEQLCTTLAPALTGHTTYFARSMASVPDDIKEIQPSIFFGVPRLWEKFHAGVRDKLTTETGAKAKLIEWAMRTARRYHACKLAGQRVDRTTRLAMRLARRLVFNQLKPKLGLGKARICLTGAAPIDAEILHWFTGLDLIVLELYGQSEGTGPTTLNRPSKARLGTVGPAYPGIDLKISEDGEILVRGPNVFAGYLHDDEATREALKDGWLHSGDLGSIDSDGFLTITGRKKDIIITAGGINITPANLEQQLAHSALVAQAVVVGDQRKYLSALISLDADAIAEFAQQHDFDVATAHDNPKVRAELQASVDSCNAHFAQASQVRRFHIVQRPFSIENGELTATLKVKRKAIIERYAGEIDELYSLESEAGDSATTVHQAS